MYLHCLVLLFTSSNRRPSSWGMHGITLARSSRRPLKRVSMDCRSGNKRVNSLRRSISSRQHLAFAVTPWPPVVSRCSSWCSSATLSDPSSCTGSVPALFVAWMRSSGMSKVKYGLSRYDGERVDQPQFSNLIDKNKCNTRHTFDEIY